VKWRVGPHKVPGAQSILVGSKYVPGRESFDMAVNAWRHRMSEAWKDDKLFCYGCAHSAASEPFPGMPSGERPCCFCARNPRNKEFLRKGETPPYEVAAWYGGKIAPARLPMDCYHTLDMKEQLRLFEQHFEAEVASEMMYHLTRKMQSGHKTIMERVLMEDARERLMKSDES
jgi:hypothetical protein